MSTTVARRGFTLVEVMVALTVAGMAFSAAGFAISAARSTAARVTRHEQRVEADSRFRALLTDWLRHAPPPELVDGALLTIDRAGATPVLQFVTAGLDQPLGTGALWRVELSLRDTVLSARAIPLREDAREATRVAPLVATLSPVEAFDVRVLEHATGAEAVAWRADWPLAQDRPRAVEVTWRWAGAPVTPLRVLLAPLAGPR
jgi:general secretion pathway protein J